MVGEFDVVVVGKGVDGPFRRDDGTYDLGPDGLPVTYPFLRLQSADPAFAGENPRKATLGPGVVYDPPLYERVRLLVALRDSGKLRVLGPVSAPAAASGKDRSAA